jgi:hypothetical protein
MDGNGFFNKLKSEIAGTVLDSIPVVGLADDATVLGVGTTQVGPTLQKYIK